MSKERVIIYGAEGVGKKIYNFVKDEFDVICFVDSEPLKWGKYNEIPIVSPEYIIKYDYSSIIVASISGRNSIVNYCLSQGIDKSKINTCYVDVMIKSRELFLNDFALLVKDNSFAVAEAGVFKGDFAIKINEIFPQNNLYLFDTFSGFDKRDFEFEADKSSLNHGMHFNNSSEEIVLARLPYKKNVKIYKGYFPETVTDEILQEKFIFVNLDMDLYKPTFEGLQIFYPLMVKGGVILVHDYFNDAYPNVKKAIQDFENIIGVKLNKTPIGDGLSLAIIC